MNISVPSASRPRRPKCPDQHISHKATMSHSNFVSYMLSSITKRRRGEKMTVYPRRRTSGEDDMSEGVPTMSISFNDVEKLQALYPDHQIELREGKIIIMSPSDGISGAIGARFIALLSIWVF